MTSDRMTIARGRPELGNATDAFFCARWARYQLRHAAEDHDRDEGERGEREHRPLAAGHDDEGRHQRPQRLTEIAADLEQALCKAVAAAGGGARDARGLGMENRAADPDQRDGAQQHRHNSC